jgi:hypothetical protein
MKSRLFAWSLAAASLVVVATVASACSSSETTPAATPCNENPWSCPAGQTCWPKDLTAFQCLNSGTAKKGEACTNTLGAPSCADGMACLQLSGSSTGFCTPFCDPTNAAHACATGESCYTITLTGASSGPFHACVPTNQPDAGGDTATETGTETGTDAASEAATETGSETGADAASEAATETGTDASDASSSG